MRSITSNLLNRMIRFISRHARVEDIIRHSTPKPWTNSDGVVFMGYSAEVRKERLDERITIGKNSVLSCHIVLERDVGKVTIGHDTYIGGSKIICAENIDIGNNVLVSWGCTIIDHDSHPVDWRLRADDVRNWREGLLAGGLVEASRLKNWDVVDKAPIRIFDKAWIGMNATILKGISIGEGSVVAAGSIVTRDVPPWTLVAGNPARVIKDLPGKKNPK